MPIIHVRISHNSKVLKDWEGLPVEKETKIKDFFEDISVSYLSPDLWDADFEVKFSSSKTLVGEKISARCIAWEAACQYGFYANFHLISQETTEFSRTPIANAFDILRANSNNIFVPEFNVNPRNALEKLRLDLSNWIKNKGGGWKGKDFAQNVGKKFVTDLASALWYVDGCSVKTLDQKFKIPEIFSEFFGRSLPENYKSSRPKFSSDELIQQSQKILNYVELSWMLQSRFNWLKEPLIKFGEILAKYAEYLEHQQIRSKEIKNSLSPIINEMEAGSIEIFSANVWRNPENINKYFLLTNELIKAEFWEPVNIYEFCPQKRVQRFRFIEGLNLAFLFKVGIYKYHHGTAQNIIYIWRINPEASETEIVNKNYEIRTKLKGQLQIFHTRAMKKELMENFELCLGKCERARLRHIISDLLGDCSASVNSVTHEVDERVNIMIELGDPEFITDLRQLSEGQINQKFDIFWDYARKYLENTVNETLLAVDERRHDTIQHLAQAISIRDLR